jgi:hypothetical protein
LLQDVLLDDIMDGDHAVNLHLSPQQPGTYIACGDIPDDAPGGTPSATPPLRR